MAKTRTQYICQNCGKTSAKEWQRCPDCGEWNTFVQSVVESHQEKANLTISASFSRPEPLAAVQSGDFARLAVPIQEFSRVLGGGIVPGSVVLIGGDPGIGKSTLLLQVSNLLARQGCVLYVSGEESSQQIKMRANRLGALENNLYVLSEINLEQILVQIDQLKPMLVIVDSIQSIYSDELTAASGSVSQVRHCAAKLLRMAKSTHIPIFIVGHVTKAGAIAGRARHGTHRRHGPLLKASAFTPTACCAASRTVSARRTKWGCSRCATRDWSRFPTRRNRSWLNASPTPPVPLSR